MDDPWLSIVLYGIVGIVFGMFMIFVVSSIRTGIDHWVERGFKL